MAKEELLQLPATIEKVETMSNRSLRLKVDTQENLNDEQRARIMQMADKLGYFLFAVQKVKPEDMVDLPEIKSLKGEKSPSKKLHDRMFVYFKKKYGQTDGFNNWYVSECERIGIKYLEKIN